jgi:hypothetical protein
MSDGTIDVFTYKYVLSIVGKLFTSQKQKIFFFAILYTSLAFVFICGYTNVFIMSNAD